MKKIISTLLASCCLTSLIAQEVVVKGPEEKLQGTDIHIYTGNPSVLGGISF